MYDNIPDLDDFLKYAYLRGYFDSKGSINIGYNEIAENGIVRHYNNEPFCSLFLGNKTIEEEIKLFCRIPFIIKNNTLYWHGYNCLEFLSKLYENTSISSIKNVEIFVKLSEIKFKQHYLNLKSFKYILCDDNAIPPYKENFTDSGWDLTLVKKIKEDENGIFYYTTSLSIINQYGYYFMVVPRSSLCKRGWILANSVGIIDATYTGPINVALCRTNPNSKEIQLPCRCIQLIPQKIEIFSMSETTGEELKKTTRGNSGGLGDQIV